MRKIFLFTLLTLMVGSGMGWADTINVPAQYSTIQAAVDAALTGDQIIVAPGLYGETINFGSGFVTDNLTISGSDPLNRPSITGGVNFQNSTAFSGLTLQNLYLTGDGGANRIINMGNPGLVSNFTMDNCILDGENISGRASFYGANLGGSVSITNCEIKDVNHWSVLDLGASTGPKSGITFTGNNIHDCNGTVALRGDPADYTDLVVVANNSWTDIGGSAWAGVEINHADVLDIYGNVFLRVGGSASGIQAWNLGTIDVYDNTFTDCWAGISVPSVAVAAAPAGAIYNNSFTGTTDFLISTEYSGDEFTTDLNAVGNYLGTVDASVIASKMLGKVAYSPWLGASP